MNRVMGEDRDQGAARPDFQARFRLFLHFLCCVGGSASGPLVIRAIGSLLCGIAACLVPLNESWAQGAGQGTSQGADRPPDIQARYDAAFQEMVKKPADLDVLFTFATLASQNNDLEGAISALERMLLINPDLPRVRLELGVLYYRLGSYEVARTYLETALQSAAMPPDVRSRAEKFLAEIEKRQSRSRFSGEFFLGTRYQSNANLGPPTSSVRLFGQVALRVGSAAGVPQLLDAGVKRLDDLYQAALRGGLLRGDPGLSYVPPVEAASDVVTPDDSLPVESATIGGTIISVQFDSPGAPAVNSTEGAMRAVPGVASAATSSLALGGISVMTVNYGGTPDAFRAALQSRGWQVFGTGTTIRIRRAPQLLPPDVAADNATAG